MATGKRWIFATIALVCALSCVVLYQNCLTQKKTETVRLASDGGGGGGNSNGGFDGKIYVSFGLCPVGFSTIVSRIKISDDGKTAHFDRMNCQDLATPVAVDLSKLRFVGPEGNVAIYDGAIYDYFVETAGAQKTTAIACSSPSAGIDVAIWITMNGPIQFHGEVSRKPPAGQSVVDNRTGAQPMAMWRQGKYSYFESMLAPGQGAETAGYHKTTVFLDDMSFTLEYNMKATGHVQAGNVDDCLVAGFTQVVSALSSQSFSTPGTHTFTVPAYGLMTVRVWGAGGGGATHLDGGDGGESSFGPYTAGGGGGGTSTEGGAGGLPGAAGDVLKPGTAGIQHYGGSTFSAGQGGSSGMEPDKSGTAGGAPGGGGGSAFAQALMGVTPIPKGWGGGGGGHVQKSFAAGDLAAGSTITITIGQGGAGAASDLPGITSGAGAHGRVLIEWQR